MDSQPIDTQIDQIFTEQEQAQLISSLKKAYLSLSKKEDAHKKASIESALQKMGWVIDEKAPDNIRTLRDDEL